MTTSEEIKKIIDDIDSDALRECVTEILNQYDKAIYEAQSAIPMEQNSNRKIAIAIPDFEGYTASERHVEEIAFEEKNKALVKLKELKTDIEKQSQIDTFINPLKSQRIKNHFREDCSAAINIFFMRIKDEADTINNLDEYDDIKEKVYEITKKCNRISGSDSIVKDCQSLLERKIDYFREDFKDCILTSVMSSKVDNKTKERITNEVDGIIKSCDLDFEDLIDATIYVNLLRISIVLQEKNLIGALDTLTDPSFWITTCLSAFSFGGIYGTHYVVNETSNILSASIPNTIESNPILKKIPEIQSDIENFARKFPGGDWVAEELTSINIKEMASVISKDLNDKFLDWVKDPVEYITKGLSVIGGVSLLASILNMRSHIRARRRSYLLDVRNVIVMQIKASVDVSKKMNMVNERIENFHQQCIVEIEDCIKESAIKPQDKTRLTQVIEKIRKL